MTKIRSTILRIFLALVFATSSFAHADNSEFVSVSYHDVHDEDVNAIHKSVLSITTKQLIDHFSWLRENGYHPISLNDLEAAKKGDRPLPSKPVLLSFDDGYQSFYTRVYPLLKLFNYPAILALVGDWMETPNNEQLDYGGVTLTRSLFLSWKQVKEMQQSGLVEVASHSYDMHHGILANPQQNTQPPVTTFQYFSEQSRYETIEEFNQRLFDDLKRSRDLIQAKTGIAPRALVWPYGAYNEISLEAAKRAGFNFTFSIDGGANSVRDSENIHRLLVRNYTKVDEYSWLFREPDPDKIRRVVHVDLDYIFDSNSEQQEKNLSHLLDRVKRYQINTVYLQAYSDANGDGVAEGLYFPNRHLPMRADLLNRVAWQLRTRTGVEVYAWMPILAYEIKSDELANALVISTKTSAKGYRRLSPFVTRVREVIGEIYEDLAQHADFAGILFHDDGYLSDFEDANTAAIATYRQWGLPDTIEQIRSNSALLDQWTAAKTNFLIDFTHELTNKVKRFRPRVKTARNIYASLVLSPHTELWFAQNYDLFLENYDYTAVMAMPYMENAGNPKRWLAKLADIALDHPQAKDRTLFELQALDWKNRKPVSDKDLRAQMRLLLTKGIQHFGYYPDDFIYGRPDITQVRPMFSLDNNPYRD